MFFFQETIVKTIVPEASEKMYQKNMYDSPENNGNQVCVNFIYKCKRIILSFTLMISLLYVNNSLLTYSIHPHQNF